MNSKAQLGVGLLIVMAVAAIVGLVLFQASAGKVGDALPALVTVTNSTQTMPATGSKLILTGQEYATTAIITNATSGTTVPTTNYTIAEEVRTTDGYKGIVVTSLGNDYSSRSVNVSYGYYPDGYVDNSAGRSITGLIVLLGAIAIALVILSGVKFDDIF